MEIFKTLIVITILLFKIQEADFKLHMRMPVFVAIQCAVHSTHLRSSVDAPCERLLLEGRGASFLQHFLLIFLFLFFMRAGLKLLTLNVIRDFCSVPLLVQFWGGRVDSTSHPHKIRRIPTEDTLHTRGLHGATQNKISFLKIILRL